MRRARFNHFKSIVLQNFSKCFLAVKSVMIRGISEKHRHPAEQHPNSVQNKQEIRNGDNEQSAVRKALAAILNKFNIVEKVFHHFSGEYNIEINAKVRQSVIQIHLPHFNAFHIPRMYINAATARDFSAKRVSNSAASRPAFKQTQFRYFTMKIIFYEFQ